MAPINFGFLLYPIQALDAVGPMDILNNICREFVAFIDPNLVEKAAEINFIHVAETDDPVAMSGGLVVKPTASFANCPKLDYFLIGGMNPEYVKTMSSGMKDFIRKQAEEVKVLFTTCTGGITLAETGVLDGLEATTNHEAIALAKEWYPKVKWNINKHWVVAGKFWTGAGAVAGMDMLAEWIAQTYGEDLLGCTLRSLSYQRRDVDGKYIGKNVCRLEGPSLPVAAK